jgi:hypothetical protein
MVDDFLFYCVAEFEISFLNFRLFGIHNTWARYSSRAHNFTNFVSRVTSEDNVSYWCEPREAFDASAGH